MRPSTCESQKPPRSSDGGSITREVQMNGGWSPQGVSDNASSLSDAIVQKEYPRVFFPVLPSSPFCLFLYLFNCLFFLLYFSNNSTSCCPPSRFHCSSVFPLILVFFGLVSFILKPVQDKETKAAVQEAVGQKIVTPKTDSSPCYSFISSFLHQIFIQCMFSVGPGLMKLALLWGKMQSNK